MKAKKTINGQQGFTLLEILVVLTIMGFLIAMVAPRLAGISSSAVDTVCDSNQNRMVTMMSGFFEKTNRFPTKLTNLVERTDNSTFYQIPSVSDDDPDNGPETLAREFMSRNHFRIHYLNEYEVAELKNMGIVQVLHLNSYDAYDDAGAIKDGYDETEGVNNDVAMATSVTKTPKMQPFTLDTDVGSNPFAVAMVGMGAPGDNDTLVVHAGERGWGEPDWFGRIVLGFGPENSLVTSGIVANAAHCPGGIQNADNVVYNDYNLVLPRLAATVARLEAATPTGVGDLTKLAAVAYDDEPGAAYSISDNDANLKSRTFNILVAQEKWQYATQCPEGHMFPADDEEFWGIDIDGDGTLD